MIETILHILSARAARSTGGAPEPLMFTWNVTERCNANCTMCEIYTWAAPAKEELTPDQFEKFVTDPLLRKVRLVRITGGEPFVRRDLPVLVAKTALMPDCDTVYITTNGSFPDRVQHLVAETEQRERLHIQVSLDALDETHDKIRGVPGMVEKAKETARQLSELSAKYGFYAGVNQTVTSETLPHMEEVARFAAELGLGHQMFLGAQFHEGKTLEDADPSKEEMSFQPLGTMSREDMERFYRLHKKLKSTENAKQIRARHEGAFLRELSEEYLNEGGRNRAIFGKSTPKPPCTAMFTHFRLTAAGDVVACSPFRKESVGNVKEQSFANIWKSAEAAALRKKVKRCKGCWIECDINPSIFFSGDIAAWYAKKVATDPEFRKNYQQNIGGIMR